MIALMKHFLLFYHYVPEYLERRVALRAAHFAHARASNERGELQLAGACTDGEPIGVLVFKTEDRGPVEQFARKDPYVLNGLVTGWHIRDVDDRDGQGRPHGRHAAARAGGRRSERLMRVGRVDLRAASAPGNMMPVIRAGRRL